MSLNPDLSNKLVRKQIVKNIKSHENVQRKLESFIDYEVYNDRIHPYVYNKLKSELSESTVKQMPIVSTLNIGKRIVKEKAVIYTEDPTRELIDNAKDKETIESLYEDMGFNSSMQKLNEIFKLRNQTFVQVVPKDNTLSLRVLWGHHVDVIPDAQDPTKAFAYIISSFDKSQYVASDGVNELIADTDDYKATLENYLVWTKDFNFIMDGNGNFKSEVKQNEIDELPFVEISKDKDFEFFVRLGQCLTDFTIQYNCLWSDTLFTNRMQGFSIGVIKGDMSLLPETITIGPSKMFLLPTNKNNPDSTLDLDFKNPNPNIQGSLAIIQSFLSNLLMSLGVDGDKINSALNGASTYGSAIERLLAMIDEFSAAKEDFDLFRKAEKQLFSIIKKYLVALTGTPFLDPKYYVTQSLLKTDMNIQFHKPEMIETQAEKISNLKAKKELGIIDEVGIIMELEGVTEEMAIEKLEALNERKAKFKETLADVENPEQENNGIGSEPNDRPE